MTGSTFGRIAQLLYADARPLDFVQVVDELHRTLSQLDNTGLLTGWDGANLASIELASVRIVLAVKDNPGRGWSTCLTVAVELSTKGAEPGADAGCQDTCSSVVEHLQRRYPAATTIWHPANEPLTGTLHDRLVAALPAQTPSPARPAPYELCGTVASERVCHAEDAGYPVAQCSEIAPALKRPAPQSGTGSPATKSAKDAIKIARKSLARSAGASARARAARARARGRAHFTAPATVCLPVPGIVTEPTSPPHEFDLEFARVRKAFDHMETEPAGRRLSAPLRLTTHALNASLIMVWPPLGTAVMTYSLLKGEDTRFSGQIVVLTGLFAAVLNTPIGQYMATIVGA